MKVKRGQIISIVVVLALAGLVVIALLPSPIKVEAARVTRGPLRVTIDEEGEARAHDRFVIAAPVAGCLVRVELHDGDGVKAGQVVAVITPSPLDPREREEVVARVQSAEALNREAEERVERARADYEQARRERERAARLARDGLVSTQSLEQAKNTEATSANELEGARFKAQAAASDVKVARAGLIAIDAERKDATRLVSLRSPVGGRVLRVIEKSERVVAVGTPIMVLGDPNKLEVVVDVLSTDAVKVKPGAIVLLEDWGGEEALRAKVRTVESSAFTKVSALGIEEQRVNIVADFVDPPGQLGDGYRVEARIIIWESKDVLKALSSALFRHGDGWSVFIIEEGIAHRREVETGHRSQFEAEILSGIREDEQIILHPANQIADGVSVEVK
jgi:HlyD family secretion protein